MTVYIPSINIRYLGQAVLQQHGLCPVPLIMLRYWWLVEGAVEEEETLMAAEVPEVWSITAVWIWYKAAI